VVVSTPALPPRRSQTVSSSPVTWIARTAVYVQRPEKRNIEESREFLDGWIDLASEPWSLEIESEDTGW
jgi:hypothetical protein